MAYANSNSKANNKSVPNRRTGAHHITFKAVHIFQNERNGEILRNSFKICSVGHYSTFVRALQDAIVFN